MSGHSVVYPQKQSPGPAYLDDVDMFAIALLHGYVLDAIRTKYAQLAKVSIDSKLVKLSADDVRVLKKQNEKQ